MLSIVECQETFKKKKKKILLPERLREQERCSPPESSQLLQIAPVTTCELRPFIPGQWRVQCCCQHTRILQRARLRTARSCQLTRVLCNKLSVSLNVKVSSCSAPRSAIKSQTVESIWSAALRVRLAAPAFV